VVRNVDIWLGNYIAQRFQNRHQNRAGLKHVIFSIVDHFEPKWSRSSIDTERQRVRRWAEEYPKVAFRHKDSEGISPKHTFFYPAEEYEREHLDKLTEICRLGVGEIEVHLHHDDDTAENLRNTLEKFKHTLVDHGLLSRDRSGRIRYGFIHGNWALDNSRADGRWCGVNNEFEVLKETGCYADFTMPSAPSETQTAKINSIYYVTDTPLPKSHESGSDVEVGINQDYDLMLVQGPLTLNWRKRKYLILPRIENGSITFHNPPTRDRIGLWVKQGVGVKGKPGWIFAKVHTHGAQDKHITDKFFKQLDDMFGCLEDEYNDGINYKLHYTSSREMYNLVKAAEAGKGGDPGEYRDYILKSNIG